ncbi:hypothetical protein TeGR_g9854 [Tetraparma gracilis]|uniref:Uncharacterized protein n=1 Tax=Tetraparma gracilis TaxID=2962635 RepID=A0ABQ6MFU5_9STRA|nr:hypothetical protein TeGR_g9854 [Tetraparma gracilis]
MAELELEYVWFRPMMDTIAQQLLLRVSWGLKMRLYTGSGLSMLDLITDAYMIYTYTAAGSTGHALSLVIMVGLCLALQLFLVWFQNRKGPRSVMLREVLIVLSGTKPGIDAKRVANGNVGEQHCVLPPDVELVCTRLIEVICESIPGATGYQYVQSKFLREGDENKSKIFK